MNFQLNVYLFLSFASCHHLFAPMVVLYTRKESAWRSLGDSLFYPVPSWPGQYLQHSCNTHRGVAFTDHNNYMATANGSTLPGCFAWGCPPDNAHVNSSLDAYLLWINPFTPCKTQAVTMARHLGKLV